MANASELLNDIQVNYRRYSQDVVMGMVVMASDLRWIYGGRRLPDAINDTLLEELVRSRQGKASKQEYESILENYLRDNDLFPNR